MGIIYTSTYRYSGADRLDITVKGQNQIGKIFAPTWDMVMGYKNGKLDARQYEIQYRQMMIECAKKNWGIWKHIVNSERITFVCFCRPGTFCHRNILAEIFHSLGCTIGGEI